MCKYNLNERLMSSARSTIGTGISADIDAHLPSLGLCEMGRTVFFGHPADDCGIWSIKARLVSACGMVTWINAYKVTSGAQIDQTSNRACRPFGAFTDKGARRAPLEQFGGPTEFQHLRRYNFMVRLGCMHVRE